MGLPWIRKFTKPKSIEPWQQQIVDYVKDFTMTSTANILASINAVQHIVKNKIDGDIVECGVWKGGNIMAIAKTLIFYGETNRRLYLYDTFGEFSKPGEFDISILGKSGADILKDLAPENSIWRAPEIEDVTKNLVDTGYPYQLMTFVKGEVEHTIPGSIPKSIALLRLDTDWYSSTFHELKWLYPRLMINGVLILDDYGYWNGCKKAVDQYFNQENVKPTLIKIDQSARMIFKK